MQGGSAGGQKFLSIAAVGLWGNRCSRCCCSADGRTIVPDVVAPGMGEPLFQMLLLHGWGNRCPQCGYSTQNRILIVHRLSDGGRLVKLEREQMLALLAFLTLTWKASYGGTVVPNVVTPGKGGHSQHDSLHEWGVRPLRVHDLGLQTRLKGNSRTCSIQAWKIWWALACVT